MLKKFASETTMAIIPIISKKVPKGSPFLIGVVIFINGLKILASTN